MRRKALISSGEVNIDNGLALSVDLSSFDADGRWASAPSAMPGSIDVDRKDALDVLDYLGADLAARFADPRSRPVLHPRLEGGRAGAARLCRRDGAVQSAGGRIPRALCGLLRSRLRPQLRPWRRCARRAGSAQPRGALHPRGRPDHRPPGLRAAHRGAGAQVYGQGIGSNYQRQGLKLSKHFKPFDPSRR